MNKDELKSKADDIAKTIDKLADAMKIAALASAIDPAVSKYVMLDLARASISLGDAAESVRCAVEELA